MSKTELAAIIIPVVVAVALAVWITMVYRADKHPGPPTRARGSKPRREVIGGSFRGTGGRQLMPLPNREPGAGAHAEVRDDADYADADGGSDAQG